MHTLKYDEMLKVAKMLFDAYWVRGESIDREEWWERARYLRRWSGWGSRRW